MLKVSMQYLLPKFALYPAIIYMLDIHSQISEYFGFHIHNIACGLLAEIVIITYLFIIIIFEPSIASIHMVATG